MAFDGWDMLAFNITLNNTILYCNNIIPFGGLLFSMIISVVIFVVNTIRQVK